MLGRNVRAIVCIIVFALASLSTTVLTTSALPAPVVQTDRRVYQYNTKDVLLSGSGFTSGRYYVWLRKTGENQSRYTGESFESTGTGNIPYPNVRVPVDPRALATYIVSISIMIATNTETATCSFGLFGVMKAVYERREIVQIAGGGAAPGSTVRIDIRTPKDVLAHNTTTVADDKGDYVHSWYLENNAPTGSWLLSADGAGTYDAVGERWHVDLTFGVRTAWLRMSIYGQPSSTYQRTQKAAVVVTIKYPDGSPVITTKKDSKPVGVIAVDALVETLPLTLTDPLNGGWIAEFSTARNETLTKNFTFTVAVGVFDDGNGNLAPLNTLRSNTFAVVPARLSVPVQIFKRSFEIMFDPVAVNTTVKYPDGTNMVDGAVVALISTGTGNETVVMRYSEQSRDWRLTRQLTISDIFLVGKWTVEITASDKFGNSGVGYGSFDVSPLWFTVSVLAASILVVVMVKWVSEEKALSRAIRRKSANKEAKSAS